MSVSQCKVYREKSFWAPWHHLMDIEVVIAQFGYYVKLASKPSLLPGALALTLRFSMSGAHILNIKIAVDHIILESQIHDRD